MFQWITICNLAHLIFYMTTYSKEQKKNKTNAFFSKIAIIAFGLNISFLIFNIFSIKHINTLAQKRINKFM